MKFTIRQLSHVAAAAQYGNFSDAARAQGLSQSSISANIALVEQELGVRLFHRHASRGVELTAPGKLFLREVSSLLGSAARFSDRVEHLADDQQDSLVISVPALLALPALSRIVADFRAAHPHILIELRDAPDHEAAALDVLSGQSGYAFAAANALDARGGGFMVETLRPHAILSINHAAAARAVVTMRECAAAPFLQSTAPDSVAYIKRAFAALDEPPRVALRAASVELLRALASRGLGFAIEFGAPATTVTHDGLPFAALPFADPQPSLSLMAYPSPAKTRSAAAAAFDGFLRARIGIDDRPGRNGKAP